MHCVSQTNTFLPVMFWMIEFPYRFGYFKTWFLNTWFSLEKSWRRVALIVHQSHQRKWILWFYMLELLLIYFLWFPLSVHDEMWSSYLLPCFPIITLTFWKHRLNKLFLPCVALISHHCTKKGIEHRIWYHNVVCCCGVPESVGFIFL